MRPTMVARILAMFIDAWSLYLFLLPEETQRDAFRIETIQKLEIFIQILENMEFNYGTDTDYGPLRNFEEKDDS